MYSSLSLVLIDLVDLIGLVVGSSEDPFNIFALNAAVVEVAGVNRHIGK